MQENETFNNLAYMILYLGLRVVHECKFVRDWTKTNKLRQNFELVIYQLETKISIDILVMKIQCWLAAVQKCLLLNWT